jgi:hypothetical protein
MYERIVLLIVEKPEMLTRNQSEGQLLMTVMPYLSIRQHEPEMDFVVNSVIQEQLKVNYAQTEDSVYPIMSRE